MRARHWYARSRLDKGAVYAFPTKRLRNYVCKALRDVVRCDCSHARMVERMDAENGPWGEWNGYSYFDMSIAEYWDGFTEFTPELLDETRELGLW